MQSAYDAQDSLWPVNGSAALKPQPAKEGTMTHTRLDENVKVYALYKQGSDSRFPHDKLRPVMFIWRNQEYRIRDITYVWRESRGESEIYHFTVSAGASVFELCYHARSLNWSITGTYDE